MADTRCSAGVPGETVIWEKIVEPGEAVSDYPGYLCLNGDERHDRNIMSDGRIRLRIYAPESSPRRSPRVR